LTFRGPVLGTWEPTSERGIHFTAVQVLVDADGQSFTDNTPDARVLLRDANNAILADGTLAAGVVAVRITPGSLIFPRATPVAGTPTT